MRELFREIAGISFFVVDTFRNTFRLPVEFSEFIRQSYIVGYKTLPLVSLTALIMGLVLTLQIRPVLFDLGVESFLPGMVFLSIVREIGPVIISLIFAGKAGSRMSAELSSMRVTEQIDAMEVSGIYPMRFLVVTRVFASTIMLPLLVIYADFISLLGSYIGINIQQNLSFSLYISQAFDMVNFNDIIPGLIKTVFFGFAIGIVSCYTGYTMNKGAEGVGIATNMAVIYASVAVFVLDLLAVQIEQIIVFWIN